VRGDATCERVNWLTQNWLVQVAYSRESGGWETLYRDPSDGRLWERTYPRSEMHGGGPPRLVLLTPEQASEKYDRAAVQKS
jgi:Immunity protein 27